MPTNRPAGIFVLGMHRSGTSAAILSLESLGLNLCSEADRLRAGRGNSNPDHGESLTVIAENDALLDLYNGSWLQPRLGPNWLGSQPVASRRTAAKAAFAAAHPAAPWACKDPRLCLTLPYWDQVLETRHPLVIVLRHPLEIVKSLQNRETGDDPHHPDSYYLALWERYLRSALINAGRHPVYILNYTDLLEDWDAATAKLSKWLVRHGLPVRRSAGRPVDPSLRHARTGSSLAGLTSDQRRLHQLSLSLTGPHHRLRAPSLGRETPRTSALFGPGPDPAAAGFLTLPAAANLRRRLAQINPLVSKRTTLFGLAVTSLLAAASVALMQLNRFGRTADADDWLTRQVQRIQIPSFASLLKLSSTIAARSYLDWAAVAAVTALLLLRKRSAAAVLLLGLFTEELVNDLLRGAPQDPTGFFAGRAFRAAVLLGLLAYLAFRLIESQLWRTAAAGLCLLLIVLTALSRVYLQVRYPSAVLASLMLGAAVAVMFIAVFEAIQKSPHRVPPPRRHPASAHLTPHIPLDDIS